MVIEFLPFHLKDKLYEIKFDSNNIVSKIVSYFVLSEQEKQTISSLIKNEFFDEFYSIFSDNVTDEEWNKTKDQIRKKFNDELLDIDKLTKS
ncbi:MAG: hypothetical protein HRU07_08690 [Nitrosopumilus sp.]|nr:hypothetical protein [Nitrosopumilus sp.]NRA06208.1 hypothetical protein [Nitrosopumilus sp.]